eukprot:2115492-Amphidinium_carterae.2
MAIDVEVTIPHVEFLGLVPLAFDKDAGRADILATFKLAWSLGHQWTMVLGMQQVYMRGPHPSEDEAVVFPYLRGRAVTEAVLNPSGVATLFKSKTLADKTKPPDFDENMARPLALLDLRLGQWTLGGRKVFNCVQPDGTRLFNSIV